MNPTKMFYEDMIDTIDQKIESGEISYADGDRAIRAMVEKYESASDNIVDVQLARLEKMHNEGKLSAEDYIKQTQAWKARRSIIAKNKEEKEREKREEEERNNKKLGNRIKNKFKQFKNDREQRMLATQRASIAHESTIISNFESRFLDAEMHKFM